MPYKTLWNSYITRGTKPSQTDLEDLAKVLLQYPAEEVREFMLERMHDCPNKDKPMKLDSKTLAASLILAGADGGGNVSCEILAVRCRRCRDEAKDKLQQTLEENDAKRTKKEPVMPYKDMFEEMILKQEWSNEELDAMASKFMEVPVEEYRKFTHESAVNRPECRKLLTDMVTRGARNPGSKCEEFLNNCRAEKERLRQEQIALRPEKFKVPAFDVKACLKEIKEEV